MVKVKRICNKCGKEIDAFDDLSGIHIGGPIGYGSAFDGEYLDLDLCVSCTDRLIKSCPISPIISLEE